MPYINSLNPAEPAGGTAHGDDIDDELRALKEILLDTFPALAGAVTASQTELNYLIGVTSAVQTQLTNLANQQTNIGNQQYIYHGTVDSNGTALNVPDGWTSANLAPGHYRITHNLGLPTGQLFPGGQAWLQPIAVLFYGAVDVQTNYFDLRWSGNTKFDFMLGIQP